MILENLYGGLPLIPSLLYLSSDVYWCFVQAGSNKTQDVSSTLNSTNVAVSSCYKTTHAATFCNFLNVDCLLFMFYHEIQQTITVLVKITGLEGKPPA